MKIKFKVLAEIIEGIYHGGYPENIDTTKELLEYLNENGESYYYSTEKREPVPNVVAEWYEKNKNDLEYAIYYTMCELKEGYEEDDLTELEMWFNYTANKPVETIINMKNNGYTIIKEENK